MRARWRLLFWIALASLIGVAWLAERWGASLWQLMSMQLAGMTIGAIAAFVAMVTGARSRWFAWVALVCWLPMAYDLGGVFGHIVDFAHAEDVPAVMFLLGGLLTPIVALWIALTSAPEENDEPIARAKVR
jgi:hypothetical protein